jgi:hypothetical protein
MSYIWNKPGFPHKDWQCKNVTELDRAEHTCEMCEREEIRFVHHLIHPEGHAVAVGCVCAGKLTGDLPLMKKMNNEAKKLAKQKQDWFKKDWKEMYFGRDIYRKASSTFHASYINIDTKTWRYAWRVDHIPSGEKLTGYSMFGHQARERINDWVKDFY